MKRIHVFLGTKAQYIKTAPLLRLMDERGVPYRLIDSGQHAALSTGLRAELGVREPDYVLGGSKDITTVPQAMAWSASLATRPLRHERREEGRRRVAVDDADPAVAAEHLALQPRAAH